MLSSILVAAALARIFYKAEYATYQQTFLAFNFVVPFLVMGIPMAVYYYVPQRRNASRAVLLENLAILTVGALLFSLFIVLGGNKALAWQFGNPDLASTLYLLMPYALFEMCSKPVGPCLMTHDRAHQVAFYNIATRLALLILAVSAALIYRSTEAVIAAAVVASFGRACFGMRLMWVATRNTSSTPTKSGLIAQIKYGVPLGLAGVFGTLVVTTDKIIVASICDLDTFAVYSVGAFEIPIVSIVTGAVTAVLLTDLSAMFAEKRLSDAISLWSRAALKCSMIILPVMVCLFVIAPDAITLLFSDKYAESVLPFRMYLLLLPIRIANYGSMIMSAGKSRLILNREIIGFVFNLLLSIALTLAFGFIGAIIATVCVIYFWTMPFNLFVIARLWRTTPSALLPWRRLFLVMSLSVAACPVLLFANFLHDFHKVLRLALLVPAYFGLVCVLFAYSNLLPKDFLSLVVERIRSRSIAKS